MQTHTHHFERNQRAERLLFGAQRLADLAHDLTAHRSGQRRPGRLGRVHRRNAGAVPVNTNESETGEADSVAQGKWLTK